MALKRDSLAVIISRVYANYMSLFKPLEKMPRTNLLKVFASVDAGMYHQLLGDMEFLSRQIFPDTASGEYLREHWSSRVSPLYAIGAIGTVIITGIPNRAVPAGIVFQAGSGERYYTEAAYRIGSGGTVAAYVRAEGTGVITNLGSGESLTIVSAIPSGIDSTATTADEGLIGGADSETDEEYLIRVLAALRNPTRYGKKDDFAAWALDSSAEVSAAWEFKNFGVFGALLVQVINGTQASGVGPVNNIPEVVSHISELAPPVLFTVRSPEIINLNPSISLLPQEDTQENRTLAEARIKAYLQMTAKPGAQITAGALKTAVIDGVAITSTAVKLGGSEIGIVSTTILQYPYVGEIVWE